jgi:hypothetical protein
MYLAAASNCVHGIALGKTLRAVIAGPDAIAPRCSHQYKARRPDIDRPQQTYYSRQARSQALALRPEVPWALRHTFGR